MSGVGHTRIVQSELTGDRAEIFLVSVGAIGSLARAVRYPCLCDRAMVSHRDTHRTGGLQCIDSATREIAGRLWCILSRSRTR